MRNRITLTTGWCCQDSILLVDDPMVARGGPDTINDSLSESGCASDGGDSARPGSRAVSAGADDDKSRSHEHDATGDSLEALDTVDDLLIVTAGAADR